MILFLSKNNTIPLEEIVLISQEKNKTKKRKTLIITNSNKKITEKNSIDVIIKRIEKQNGFLK